MWSCFKVLRVGGDPAEGKGVSEYRDVNLRQFIKFVLWRDTTFRGQYRIMKRLVGKDAVQAIVDVGANDGFYDSKSYPFVAHGWRALLIEPQPIAFERLSQRYAGSARAVCLNLACGERPAKLPLWVGEDGDTTQATFAPEAHAHFANGCPRKATEVEVERLDTILARQGFPKDFGILTLDTEGWDHEVLNGLDLTVWQPRCIVTEDGEREKPGAKAAYLRQGGYRLIQHIPPDGFWLREN